MHAWIVVLILFASLGLVVFCYVGYPLLMMAMARSQARPVQASDWLPSVDVIVAVHNASDSVIAKIDNLLALDYPVDRLHLRIGSDGSDDDTVERVHAYLTRHSLQSRVSIAEFAQRRGKSACLADLIAQSDADIVFFTDVRQRIESCALKALVRPLADPMIGAVSGELMFENADGFAASIDTYWRYEKAIRRSESASGSVVGVTGAIWAARRTALPKIPEGIVLDDVWMPLAIAANGLRVQFCGDAIAWDAASSEPTAEALRKRRTLAGNFQLIARQPSLLCPGSHPLAWRLWGHKWLRLASPWLLMIALLCNIALEFFWGRFSGLLALQLLVWSMAAFALMFPVLQRFPPLRIVALFARMNGYSALALFDFWRATDSHLWVSSTKPGRP